MKAIYKAAENMLKDNAKTKGGITIVSNDGAVLQQIAVRDNTAELLQIMELSK